MSARGLRATKSLVAVAGVTALAAACAVEETVIADVPLRPGSGACARDGDCPEGAFCAKATCGDTMGACQRKPFVCGAEQELACGCDGVTYWNDCLRRQRGVAAATPGECVDLATLAACGGRGGAACPAGAICAQRVEGPPACAAPPPPGSCWVLPPSCGAEPEDGGARGRGPARGGAFGACNDARPCLDLCDALKAGPVFRAPRACP